MEKKIYEKAKELKIELIDLTCPKVLQIHKIASEYAKQGYFIFLTGENNHPEMIGTVSFCEGNYYIIEDAQHVEEAVNQFKKLGKEKALLISQTTYSLNKFEEISKDLKQKIENIEIKNTICNATKQRQEETEQIAKQVEIMIIIGGKNSSNANKLYELSKKHCGNVIFVGTEEQLNTDKIKNINTIGIMAGASTPQESIEKVVEKIKRI